MSGRGLEQVVGDGAAPRQDSLVLGGDIGGTTTRIIIADRAGRVHGRGTSAGGNPVSHPATAAAAFSGALASAAEEVDTGRVRQAVVGVAGGSALRDPAVRAEFAQAWRSSIGASCEPAYVSDLEVAFASGTAEPDGTVLIAGTGAIAGAIRGHRLVATVDGHGWLLGDEGSGFWVGREAVRATLRVLDDPDGRLDALARSVLRDLAGPDGGRDATALRDRIIEVVNGRSPVRLAELAPLVTAAHAAGDPVAGAIIDDAAQRLSQLLGRLPGERRCGPVVLAGALTGPDNPVGALLRGRLADTGAAAPHTARDGVTGAAWLALTAMDPDAATPAVREHLAASSR